MLAASKNKKLRIHTGTHFHPFHSEEGRLDQLRFFDHWLKGHDTGIMDEPPVKLQIRTGGKSPKEYKFRFENEWPLARTQWTRMYLKLDAAEQSHDGKPEGELVPAPVSDDGQHHLPGEPAVACRHSIIRAVRCGGRDRPHRHLVADRPVTEDTEVTGPMVLVLWVSSTSEDVDLFATIRNIGPDGKDVWEAGQQGWDEVPVTKGWLRASHRKLDPERSLPYRPYHAHDERQWLEPGRDRRVPRRDLAEQHGVQERPPHPARHPAARRRRRLGLSSLSAGLQHRGEEHDPRRRGVRILSDAAGHSGDVAPQPGWSEAKPSVIRGVGIAAHSRISRPPSAARSMRATGEPGNPIFTNIANAPQY